MSIQFVGSLHLQAITTRAMGPTNNVGSRIRATCKGGTTTVRYDYQLGDRGNHEHAVQMLCTKLGWSGKLVSGGLSDGNSMAWVFVQFGDDQPMQPVDSALTPAQREQCRTVWNYVNNHPMLLVAYSSWLAKFSADEGHALVWGEFGKLSGEKLTLLSDLVNEFIIGTEREIEATVPFLYEMGTSAALAAMGNARA